jgi:beta-lactamase regulating signal transducer with metallopeptidase domain
MSGCSALTLLVNASLACVAVAIVAHAMVRGRSAALRHAVWVAIAGGMLVYPALEQATPLAAIPTFRWELPAGVKTAVASGLGLSHWTLFELLYLGVAGVLVLRVIAGAVVLAVVARRGQVIFDPAVRACLGDARVDVVEHGAVRVPATVGLLRSRILLPLGWRDWSLDKLRSVLLHELAHVRRRDPLTQLVARLIACVYWFHPLAHVQARRLAELAELAADAAVVRAVPDRRAYARHLVEIAGALAGSHRRVALESVPLVRAGQLDARIAAILAPARGGWIPRRTFLALALAVATLWAAAAAVRVVSRDPAPEVSPWR